MVFDIKEVFGALGDRRRQIVAETLASMAYDRLSEHFVDPLFEGEWVNQKIGNTSVLAREVISVACHGMAGVAHTFSFTDGLLGEFSSRVIGDTLSDVAGKVRRHPGASPVITVQPGDYNIVDAEIIFDEETRTMAAERLAAKFDARHEDIGGSSSSSRLGRFLDILGASIKHEAADIMQGLRDFTQTMDSDRKRMATNPFSRRPK